jgi:hypothetical protein
MSAFLDKEIEKLRKKAAELDDKRYEAFRNHQDTGYEKYYKQMVKAEDERDEIEEFLYSIDKVKIQKKQIDEYYQFTEKLKKKITDMLEENDARYHSEANSVLGSIFSYIAVNEP